MRCPRCDHELDGRPAKCVHCKGCWVSAQDVPRTVKSHEKTWTDAGESKITCPECYAPMQAILLNGVHLDRCAHHGVWFDIGEITDMLRTTGKLGPDEVAREDKPSTGARVVEGSIGVGAAILGVMADIVDTVT